MRKFVIFFLGLAVSLQITYFGFSSPVLAEEQGPEAVVNQTFTASIGETSLDKDLSFSAFNDELQVGFPKGRFLKPTVITLSKIPEVNTLPQGLTMIGQMYQIDVPADSFVKGKYYISIKSSTSNAYKQVYFYDKNLGWRPLETNENFAKGVISTAATFPFLRFAVFEDSKKLMKGDASWYKYKNGLFAASPDFPAGTKLRVINLDNKKFVDVTVNDYGPDRSVHPERVIDLDAVAFKRLAPLGQGTVKVAVEKINTDKPLPTPTPSVPPVATNSSPIQAKAALVLNSADKQVIWSKAENTQVPLASLTKLVAVKVFLDTNPDLKKVVAYSVKDEEMNALYVHPSESARLKLQDNDQVTIKDLVYSSLIGSTNNTVESLVRVSGLSRTEFIKRMNQTVKGWGTTQTAFVEPTGLSPKNVTTPQEYAIIARQVFLDPVIANVSVIPEHTVTTINTKKSHTFKNTNLLAREKNSPILGSKTGYLTEAGYCLATKWPTTKDKNIIVVLFGAPSRQASVDDTKKLVAMAEKMIQ